MATTTLPGLPGTYAASMPTLTKQETLNQIISPAHEELLRPMGSGPQYSQDLITKVQSGQAAVPGTLDIGQWQNSYLSDAWTQDLNNQLRQSATYRSLASQPYVGSRLAEEWARNEYQRQLNNMYSTYTQQQRQAFDQAVTDQQALAGLAGGSYAVGGNPYLSEASQQYQKLITESKDVANRMDAMAQAAQARLDEMPGAWGEREQNLTSYLEGLGQSQRDELARQEAATQASLQQDMINRGMISTSVLDSLRGGIRSNFGQQRNALEDTLTREKMDYMRGITGETLEANERAIGGAKDTARQIWEMQQSPLAARQAYADALAKQREFDLSHLNQMNEARMQTALGYAQLRSQEGIAAQQNREDRNKLLAEQHMNYSGLVNNLYLQDMQAAVALAQGTSMPGYTYGLYYNR